MEKNKASHDLLQHETQEKKNEKGGKPSLSFACWNLWDFFQLLGRPAGDGTITSQVIGESNSGTVPSNRCNMVEPVQVIPTMTIGSIWV